MEGISHRTIKIVGPCKSGKTTLAAGLVELGFVARSCSQEHSDVATMWQRIEPARWLVFLDVSLAAIRARSPRSDWSEAVLEQQLHRLAHARRHADLVILTDEMQPDQVLARVVEFLLKNDVLPIEG